MKLYLRNTGALLELCKGAGPKGVAPKGAAPKGAVPKFAVHTHSEQTYLTVKTPFL